MVQTGKILLADECWVALALLQREQPRRVSFSAREIRERLQREKAHPEVRAGVPAHIYQHNVANVEPSSARYRMFYRIGDEGYRLWRAGDHAHPSRKGKTMPDRSDLPIRYHPLLHWYQKEYCSPGPNSEADRLLQLRGVGKELWAELGGADAFVARERAGWEQAEPRAKRRSRTWQ